MRPRRTVLVLCLCIGVLAAACTSTPSAAPPGSTSSSGTDARKPSWLFTLRATSAHTTRTGGDRITIRLDDLDPTAVAFTDRPDRQAGVESSSTFAERWKQRFGDSPPDAALVAQDATEAGRPTATPPPSIVDPAVSQDTIVISIDSFSIVDGGAVVEARLVDLRDGTSPLAGLADGGGPVPDELALRGVALFVDDATQGPDDTGTPATTEPSGPTPASSATPHIDAVLAALRKTNPTSEGLVWSLTKGNALEGSGATSWILQTPDCWGKTTCSTDSFTRFTNTLTSMTSDAETVVDVTTLIPFPDGQFRDALVAGLATAHKAGKRPLIRVTAGVPPTYSIDNTGAATWRDALVADIAKAADVDPTTIKVAVSAVATSYGWSWNHAKVVAVDGRVAAIGGHNLWTADYLQTDNPINDVTLVHRGPVAAEAHRFVDLEWGFVCRYSRDRVYVSYAPSAAVTTCPAARPPLPAPTPVGNVTSLSIGRLGMGIANPAVDAGPLPTDLVSRKDAKAVKCSVLTDDYTNRGAAYERSNPGEPALRALIASATTSVTLTQMDLLGICEVRITPKWDVRVFDALADRITAGVEVNIVISTPGTKNYTTGGTLADISNYLLSRVEAKVGNAERAKQLYCAKVVVAPLRFNDSMNAWPNGQLIGNHTKVVAVDRSAFYVGSQNLYPAWLQEYGVITEDAAAADTFSRELLDPMVKYSSRARDTSVCP